MERGFPFSFASLPFSLVGFFPSEVSPMAAALLCFSTPALLPLPLLPAVLLFLSAADVSSSLIPPSSSPSPAPSPLPIPGGPYRSPPVPPPGSSPSPAPSPGNPPSLPAPPPDTPFPSPTPAPSPVPGGPYRSPPARPPGSYPSPAPSPGSPLSLPAPRPDTPFPAPTPAPSPVPTRSGTPSPAPVADNEEIRAAANADDAGEDGGDRGMSGWKKAAIGLGMIVAAALLAAGVVVYKKRQENIQRFRYGYVARNELL